MSVYGAREAKNLPGAYENQPRWRSRNGSPAAVKRRRATLASAQVELPRTKHRQLTGNLLDSDADQTPTAWFVDDSTGIPVWSVTRRTSFSSTRTCAASRHDASVWQVAAVRRTTTHETELSLAGKHDDFMEQHRRKGYRLGRTAVTRLAECVFKHYYRPVRSRSKPLPWATCRALDQGASLLSSTGYIW